MVRSATDIAQLLAFSPASCRENTRLLLKFINKNIDFGPGLLSWLLRRYSDQFDLRMGAYFYFLEPFPVWLDCYQFYKAGSESRTRQFQLQQKFSLNRMPKRRTGTKKIYRKNHKRKERGKKTHQKDLNEI